MKAIRYHRYGGPDVLQYEEAPMPLMEADEVLIKVHAVGVNPADWKFRAGWYAQYVPLVLPFIPGSDIAGTVMQAGAAVSQFKAGDAVFAMAGMMRNGTYAEYAAVRANEVAFAPRTIDLEQAAGVPLAALTAWLALFDTGHLADGQTVLIHAAAGGVGGFAVQLAKHAGARVIATCSAANAAYVTALGADQVIDYQTEDFSARLQGIDMVLDTIGGATQQKSWGVLREDGILVNLTTAIDMEAAARHRVRAAPAHVIPHGARLAEIAALIDSGVLRVTIGREFSLADAGAAQVFSESGRARGKIILRVT
jgi:NADPH:quinone reductase-like Zn-dependent oxidoreductase